MLLKIAQSKIISVILFLGLLLLCIFYGYSAEPKTETVGWYNWSSNWPQLLKLIISLASSLSLLLLLKSIASTYRFIQSKTVALEFFYWLFLIALPSSLMLPMNAVASLFSGLMLYVLLQIHNQNSVIGLVFLASLLASVASMISIYFVAFYILVIITVLLLRSFNLKNVIVLILGFILPYFYYFGIAYLLNYQIQVKGYQFLQIRDLNLNFDLQTLTLSTIALISVFSIFYALFKIQKLIVRQRNQIVVISLYLLVSIIIAILFTPAIMIIPIASAASFFFNLYYQGLNRKWIVDSVILSIWLMAIWNNYTG